MKIANYLTSKWLLWDQRLQLYAFFNYPESSQQIQFRFLALTFGNFIRLLQYCDNFYCEWRGHTHPIKSTLCDAIFYLQQSQKFSLVFISVYSGTGIILAMFALWYLSLAVEEIRYVRSLVANKIDDNKRRWMSDLDGHLKIFAGIAQREYSHSLLTNCMSR